jgi:proteasome lid subunit RPN8/RPN11
VRARNERQSPTRFLIHAEDHLNALRIARSTGRRLIGAYHSHPSGPSVPSETDRAEMNDSSLLYVIVSLAADEPDVRAYEWKDGDFRSVEITPVD